MDEESLKSRLEILSLPGQNCQAFDCQVVPDVSEWIGVISIIVSSAVYWGLFLMSIIQSLRNKFQAI